MLVIPAVILWVVCALGAGFVARSNGRDLAPWFFIGLVFGLFGLIAAVIAGKPETIAPAPATAFIPAAPGGSKARPPITYATRPTPGTKAADNADDNSRVVIGGVLILASIVLLIVVVVVATR